MEAVKRDYSLTGRDAKLAEEGSLANAEWYACKIPRARLKELMHRRDGPAIRDTLIWFVLIIVSGVLGYKTWGTGWAVPCFFAYGLLYGSASGPRWHESGHRTAFKTVWMNDILYEIASFMYFFESVPWRWSHTRHHTDTIIVGRDPEISASRPPDLLRIALDIFSFVRAPKEFAKMVRHCFRRLTPAEETYIPDQERHKVYRNARIYIFIYALVIIWAIAIRSILLLMYVGLPTFYGGWLMSLFSLSQHGGLAEDVLDHRAQYSHYTHESYLPLHLLGNELPRRAPYVPDGALSHFRQAAPGIAGGLAETVPQHLGSVPGDRFSPCLGK